jgi:hypothetical protein
MQVPENIRRRPSRQERWEIVQTLLERKDLINNARAAFRQAYPNAPEEMLQTAIFHTYVDGIGAAIDWLTDLELFLREPNDGLDIGNTSHLLYHLYNWKQDLICSLNHTDILVLETEVADSDKPLFEYEFTDRNDYDQSITETRRVKRVSANHIEHVLEENNFSFVRCDDEDLNSTMHIYDWKVSGSSEKENLDPNNDMGRRRFWIAKRK